MSCLFRAASLFIYFFPYSDLVAQHARPKTCRHTKQQRRLLGFVFFCPIPVSLLVFKSETQGCSGNVLRRFKAFTLPVIRTPHRAPAPFALQPTLLSLLINLLRDESSSLFRTCYAEPQPQSCCRNKTPWIHTFIKEFYIFFNISFHDTPCCELMWSLSPGRSGSLVINEAKRRRSFILTNVFRSRMAALPGGHRPRSPLHHLPLLATSAPVQSRPGHLCITSTSSLLPSRSVDLLLPP